MGALRIYLRPPYHFYLHSIDFIFIAGIPPCLSVAIPGRELRKVQVLGGSTFTVSIPKRWVQRLGIGPGDYVSLELTKEGHLLLRPGPGQRPEERKVTVDPCGLLADDLQRRLIGLYLAGYRTIEVRSTPRIHAEAMQVIRDLPRKVSGLELVQETEGRAVLEDLIDPSRFSIRLALDRMYSLLRFALVRAVDGLLGRDEVEMAQCLTGLQDVERLSWIVLKQQRMIVQEPALAEEMGVDPTDASSYAICAQNLKGMAGACRDLLELVETSYRMEMCRAALLECVEVGNAVISICDRGLFAFTRNDLDAAAECLSALTSMEERLAEVRAFVSRTGAGKEGCAACLVVSGVLEILRRIARLAGGVAELAFQKATAYG
jgi:AbrB family looped-hinge helix DNA binding protein